nr:formate/nitrite transporter family protein [Thalassobacillus pellis]
MKEAEKTPIKKADNPDRQFYIPSQIVNEFGEKGRDHLAKPFRAQMLLAFTAGSFMTFGAAFSILLGIDIEAEGIYYLLSGLGFAAGYAMVFISGAVLFTEINVLLPTYKFHIAGLMHKNMVKFWLATYLGNIVGALFVAVLIQTSGSLSDPFYMEMRELLHKKMKFMQFGVKGWFEVIISGILANWMIGMAAFLTTAARDITGKLLGTTLPVILFVAGNFQHSAANMGYFSLGVLSDTPYAWYEFILFNLIPASIGNIIGGALLVALIFTYAYKEDLSSQNDN